MPMPDLPDIAAMSLTEIVEAVHAQRLPPVATWAPTRNGDSEMRIAADGVWYHQGSPIRRENMTRLFSTILRKEADGSHVLVTPTEKLSIVVDDAPFLAVEVKVSGEGGAQTLSFRLNSGDLVVAGEDHPIRFAGTPEAPRPYLVVRGGMEALIVRSVYYELANLALDTGDDAPGLWSQGVFFAVTTE
jgi:uncharacterized protein